MASQDDPPEPAPKGKNPQVREQALALLRETRAKIDPALLSVMKDKLSHLVQPPQTAVSPPEDQQVHMPLSAKTTRTEKSISPRETSGLYQKTASLPKGEPGQERSSLQDSKPAGIPADSEPVDRQKVAKIIMEYMKRRQETSSH